MEDSIIQTKPSRRTKFAIFDFDWTLVKPKDGRKFPKDKDDWMYYRQSVPNILKKYGKTHHIVIVTDQSKPWKLDQINSVMADLALEHLTLVIGIKTQKPETALFNKAFPKFKQENAFYVGDAAGRPDDWSDKDKVFAQNLNVKFHTPEEIFPPDKIVIKPVKALKTKEVVIMMGYPGSGKSTIAHSLGYHVVSGDLLKTTPAMIKDAEKVINEKSVVFDSTAGTKAKRHEFVKFAQKHNLPVRVIWVNVPIDVAMNRNKQRETKVPDVVFYVYRKHFEEPKEEEGFSLSVV